MLLHEILNKTFDEDDSMLFEDLGNLKFINKKFVRALKKVKTKRVPHDSEYGYKDVTAYDTINGLGQNGEVTTLPLKTAGAISAALDVENNLGVVVSANREQFLIVTQFHGESANRHFNIPQMFNVGLDIDVIRNFDADPLGQDYNPAAEALTNDIAMLFGEKVDAGQRVGRGGRAMKTVAAKLDDITFKHDVTKSKITQLSTLFYKYFKNNSTNVQITAFSKDKTLAAKKRDRSNSRYKMTPDHSFTAKERKEFADSAKSDLRRRLDKFKASKAIGVDTIEELVDAIKSHGYLDKIKIAGYTYKETDSQIRISYLKNPKEGKCYVQYELDSNSAEYAEWEEARSRIWATFRDDTAGKEAALEAMSKPPSRVKIYLRLEGGLIAPYEVETSNGYF